MWQIVINGPGYLDTEYELPEGETLLGRGEENHIVLAGALVSRRHARLVVEGEGLLVADAGSRNGTLLNGMPLEAAARLDAGDRVEIGENRLRVQRVDALSAGTTVILRQEPSASLARLDSARSLDAAGALAKGPEVAALVLLYQVSEKLASAPSLERFLEEVADLVLELARARTVVVQLGAALAPAVVRHRGGLAAGEVPVSRSVVEECLRTRATLCVTDAAQDARFAGSESVVHYGVTEVICAPLLREGAVEGILYLTRDADDVALRQLVETIAALAHLAGAGIEQQRLRERAVAEEQRRQRLARFLGAGLAAELAADLDGGSHMEEREATLLFADISGFTPLTERLPAARVVELLDGFYRRMARVVFAHGGTVDKFIGDAVMAIFGAPRRGEDDAARALDAALSMRTAFDEMMAGWPEADRCSLRIGVNTGRVLAGTVGGEERLEYTAVGDAVNVAARLVGEASPGQIVAGSSTVRAAGPGFAVRSLGQRQLKGRSGMVEVAEIVGREVVP
ncbi:adenylate/guanylate cyclase domain-containing protein [Vulgatibacter sp.]|uniref:adenylate/guanylate cyclase domain-containing protein n=1 Tax=Vulgatibacter sp. TaxID=1971226 RepID=UPI003561DD6D